MKKQLIFLFFSLVLAFFLQNCKYAKIDSIVNNSSEVGFTTINAKGRIIDYKDGTPTAHGHCYSPTVEVPEIGLPGTYTTETPYVDVDFESEIDSLIFDQDYFVRPYMRNGDKVVYGEVQKIRTRTPSVAIKNFAVRIKRITIPLPSDSVLFETSISISEPLKVFPLTTSLNARDYGFVFCKAADTTKLVNANDTVFPTGTGIFDMRFPSTNIVTTDPKISIDKRENISDILNPSRKSFFSDVTNNYYTRAYIKLNRGGVIEGGVIRGDDIKYYYSNLITFPKKTSSLFNFKMPIIP